MQGPIRDVRRGRLSRFEFAVIVAVVCAIVYVVSWLLPPLPPDTVMMSTRDFRLKGCPAGYGMPEYVGNDQEACYYTPSR